MVEQRRERLTWSIVVRPAHGPKSVHLVQIDGKIKKREVSAGDPGMI